MIILSDLFLSPFSNSQVAQPSTSNSQHQAGTFSGGSKANSAKIMLKTCKKWELQNGKSVVVKEMK